MFHVLELIVIILLLVGMLGVLLRFFFISLRRLTGVQPGSPLGANHESPARGTGTRGPDPWAESGRRLVVEPDDPTDGRGSRGEGSP